MFGVEHQLAYGLVVPIDDDEVVVRFVTDFGPIASSTALTFRAVGNEHSRAYLPVRSDAARVIAVDQHDRPVLLEQTVGAGRTVLCTYPLEHIAAVTPSVNPEPTYRVYEALAESAGITKACHGQRSTDLRRRAAPRGWTALHLARQPVPRAAHRHSTDRWRPA